MKRRSRWITLLLAALMVWSMLPVTALAEDFYTVHFEAGESAQNVPEDRSVESGDVLEWPWMNPTRDGYRFYGWFTDETYTTEWRFAEYVYSLGGLDTENADKVIEDVTLHAKWVRIYYITFDAKGGTAENEMFTTIEGGRLQHLPQVSREGYILRGWYLESGEQVTTDTVFTGDTTIYAQWEKDSAADGDDGDVTEPQRPVSLITLLLKVLAMLIKQIFSFLQVKA